MTYIKYKGSHLLNGDCRTILPKIATNSIDLVITDCPYKIVQGGCTNKKNNGIFNSDTNKEVKSGKLFKHNSIKFHEWLPEVYRVLKANTHCYIMINGRNLSNLTIEATKVGFKYVNTLVWVKNNVTPNRYYLNKCEFILLLRKGKARTINNAGNSNIIEIPNILGCKIHPTEKPIKLMEYLLLNSSNKGDTILDPFAGSYSTITASILNNRKAIGIEIDTNYFNKGIDRLKELR